MRPTKGEKIFSAVNMLLLFILAAITLYPIVYVVSASISSVNAISTGQVVLFPKEINFNAYKEVFRHNDIWVGYANAVYYTVVGTAVSLTLTVLGAYPLSKKRLMGKKWLLGMVVLTLFFQAGTIPKYLNFVELGMLNTREAITLGFACTSMYVIILRTFFQSVPEALEEATVIDGANQWQVLWRIYLPLSKAALATVSLMYGVGRWNSYFWQMVLLTNPSMQPLQVVLKRIIVDTTFEAGVGGEEITDYSLKMMTYAVIVVSIIPMMAVYPFVQKYFEKGIMIGSVKG